MADDSPLPFLVFRSPAAPPQSADVYQLGLEVAGLVHQVIERPGPRIHLRDRMDRISTALVVELARAAADVKPGRWRHYRAAHALAVDCATLLDLVLQQAAAPAAIVEPARTAVRGLLAVLQPLTLG